MALGQWLISATFWACGLAVRHRDDAKYVLRDKYIERSGTSAVSRRSVIIKFAVVCAATLAVGGCKNSAQVFEDQNDGGWFAQPLDLFGKPDWARPSNASVSLAPKGPVSAEQLVSADGRCAHPLRPRLKHPSRLRRLFSRRHPPTALSVRSRAILRAHRCRLPRRLRPHPIQAWIDSNLRRRRKSRAGSRLA